MSSELDSDSESESLSGSDRRPKRTKTAAYLHQGLTTRANGPVQQDGERQVQ
jgi:hypothetical protein